MKNIMSNFYFVTRSLSEDYRVFSNSGKNTHSDGEIIAPIRNKCNIIPEEGTSIHLFEDNGKIYLYGNALKLDTKTKDVAGRPIRFSFLYILPNSNDYVKKEALRMFAGLCTSIQTFNFAVQKLRKEVLVDRTDWQGKKIKGEDIEFNENQFISLLKEKAAHQNITSITPCDSGKYSFNDIFSKGLFPKSNLYFKAIIANKTIECAVQPGSSSKSNNSNNSKSKVSKETYLGWIREFITRFPKYSETVYNVLKNTKNQFILGTTLVAKGFTEAGRNFMKFIREKFKKEKQDNNQSSISAETTSKEKETK